MDESNQTYSVIGVRADSSRHLVSLNLSFGDAQYLKEVLTDADIFAGVLVEPDDPAHPMEVQLG